jgi:hypothetical protein
MDQQRQMRGSFPFGYAQGQGDRKDKAPRKTEMS